MDKNAIKKYAVWARTELIDRVTQKAAQYGIEKKNIVDATADSIHGKLLTPTEKKQRQALIAQIKQKDFDQVMEEVAYTWFNRFVALRFMEVNGYLPSHVRVFTDDANTFNPQIITEAINLEIDGIDMEKVYALKDANNDDELFKYLIIVQCNALSALLPRMFQRIDDYTELLFPDNLLRDGSVIHRMITGILERDWTDQVEILGWMYQDYISDKHDLVVDPLRGKAIKKEDIPAATQLFTTNWVVRYMVDNSLGRYWIERHPESTLVDKLEFFVKPQNGEITYIKENIQPQEVTFFDPCMGSGHILVYAFDVLMEIYRECGYTDREAVSEIIQNNLYGLDIDERCSQLAYFAVMMKARSYDRRFLTRGIKPHVLSIRESNTLGTVTRPQFMPDKTLNKIGEYLIDLFRHAKEIGSLKTAKAADYEAFQTYLETCADEAALDIEMSLWQATEMPLMAQLAEQAQILSQKYAVVCTNPPYLGKFDGKLKEYVLAEYKPYSGDLFSVFMYHNFVFCKKQGYSAFMTPNVWMSIKSYQSLREYIMREKSMVALVQMAHGAFNEVACVDVCAFVLKNSYESSPGVYIKLSEFKGGMDTQGEKCLYAIHNDCNYKHYASSDDLMLVPGSPITAYSATKKTLQVYKNACLLEKVAEPKQGLATADNNRFLRMWYEVAISRINFRCRNFDETDTSDVKWYPYNKGGDYRKWYGNNDYVVNWQYNGSEIKSFTDGKGKLRSRPQNTQFYFRECISWSLISSYSIAFRYKPHGFIFDIAGMSCFSNSEIPLKYLLALNNSCLISSIMLMLAPTINYQSGNIANIPVIYDRERAEGILRIVEENIDLAKEDWDAYETSWDFTENPLLRIRRGHMTLSDAYVALKQEFNSRFTRLHENEELLNRIFLEIYDVVGEIPWTVSRRDVSHTFLYDTKDEIPTDIRESYYVRTKSDIVRNLISYAVGCMFGRYSLDVPGLAYAGGEWDDSKYVTFKADKDSIIPICDDEYFSDDIVGRFIRFIEVVFGKDTLQENLRFIADALGGSGQPKDVIRKYFMDEFYSDHLKIYQKRPIYWLFDSGKKNGFKALVYMHRYQPDTIARMRTDYVHEQQARYRTAIADLEQRIASASTAERVKLSKRLKKLQEQATEIQSYEEKIHHLADQYIAIDLDDGVKKNYGLFQEVLAKIK